MQINLLPWREVRNKKQQRHFYVLISATLLITFLGSSILIINRMLFLRHQQQQIAQLQEQAQIINTKIAPYLVTKKLNDERVNYQQLLQLLQQLTSQMPADIYLTVLQKKAQVFYISGKSTSHADLALLLKRLEGVTTAQLQLTETRHSKDTIQGVDFDLTYIPQQYALKNIGH